MSLTLCTCPSRVSSSTHQPSVWFSEMTHLGELRHTWSLRARPLGLSTCFILPGLQKRRVICHAQFRTASGITLQTRSTDAPSNHDLEGRDRFSTFWLACSIIPALALDAFGVLHTGSLTALVSFRRVLSVGLNASRAPTNLASTPVPDMTENAAPDSKRFKTAFTYCGTAAFDEKK